MFAFEGKVALVTGAFGGIGWPTVEELFANKIHGVVLVDLDKDCDRYKQLETKYGPKRVLFVKADISQLDQCKEIFKQSLNHFNSLNIVFNIAGMVDEEEYSKVVNVNLTGTMHMTNLALETFKAHNISDGVIINVASILTVIDFPESAVYCATKAAVLSFSRNMGKCQQMTGNNVRIMCMCPGLTDTNLLAPFVGRMDEIEDFLKQSRATNQPADCVAKGMIKMLKCGTSGSAWMASNRQEAFEFNFDDSNKKILQNLQV